MSDALIAFMFFMVIFTISLLSIHAKLDELDDDLKKVLGLESRINPRCRQKSSIWQPPVDI
jgi:hypothetical protein